MRTPATDRPGWPRSRKPAGPLRYVSRVISFVRTATKDTELRGVRVTKGDRVAMFYPSANRDETHFTDPTAST